MYPWSAAEKSEKRQRAVEGQAGSGQSFAPPGQARRGRESFLTKSTNRKLDGVLHFRL